MKPKFIITGGHNINKNKIASDLLQKSEAMSICKDFTTNTQYKDSEEYIYLENSEINNAYKNNAFLVISETTDNCFEGITMEEFDRCDIAVMELEQFNSISLHVFELNDITVIWVDCSKKMIGKQMVKDSNEAKYLMERLLYIKYLYFLNETNETITSVILDFSNSDVSHKNELLKKYQ